MKKYTSILFLAVALIYMPHQALAQCNAIDSLIYGFNNPTGSGAFSGYLCGNTDSVGTFGQYGYYNGDGYVINLVAGSQVTLSVDSCTGNNVSLTVNDSAFHSIAGAYAAPACPNILDFTATYTGAYIIVMNKNGVCGGSGTSVIGEVYVKIKTGTSSPVCPDANLINDTICGAISLSLDTFAHGNSALASLTDPLDSYVVSLGDSCSPPNNTLWYSFTSPVNIDTVYIWVTSDAGSNFHSWLIGFIALNSGNPCQGGLSFLGCINGADDANGIDTVNIPFYGIVAGKVYYFMIDGFNGGAGGFSLAVKSSPFTSSIGDIERKFRLSVFPNPSSEMIKITSAISDISDISIINSSGQEIFSRNFENLLSREIDIKDFKPGFYTLRILNPKITIRKKILIIH